jgi:monoamine oxidase
MQSSPSSTEDLERIRDMIHDLSVEVGTDTSSLGKLDTMNLDQFVVAERACDETRRMVNVWTQVMLGVDSTEISAACFVDYCGRGGGLMQMRSDRKHGGQYLKVRQGEFLSSYL